VTIYRSKPGVLVTATRAECARRGRETVETPDCASYYDWVYPTAVTPTREAVTMRHYETVVGTVWSYCRKKPMGTMIEEVGGAQQSLTGRKKHLAGNQNARRTDGMPEESGGQIWRSEWVLGMRNYLVLDTRAPSATARG